MRVSSSSDVSADPNVFCLPAYDYETEFICSGVDIFEDLTGRDGNGGGVGAGVAVLGLEGGGEG